jgi:hypothetical protein
MISAVAATSANAQSSYPCASASDLPNPYRLVTGWAQTPRPWGPNNAMTVDANNNLTSLNVNHILVNICAALS